MVVVSHHAGQFRLVGETSTLVIVLVLSGLMVSRVRFRSFKDLRITGKTVGVLLLLTGACASIVIAGLEKAFIFLFLVVAYIGLGLAEEIIFFRSRRAEARDAARAPTVVAPAGGGDEEVLRELGAFDDPEDEATTRPPLEQPGHPKSV
jgi:CDP-diacylglycerol--serine O-phosphatidyltransferase